MSAKISKVSNRLVSLIERIDSLLYDFGDKIF